MRALAFLLLVAVSAPAVAEPTCDDLRGRWQTEMGAIVNIDAVDDGRLRGSYQPASLLERHFPLTGLVNLERGGDPAASGHYAPVISFSVSFEEYGGITNWTGICRDDDGETRLETQDLVARPVAEAAWAHVVASHDRLVPLPAEEPPAPAAPAGEATEER